MKTNASLLLLTFLLGAVSPTLGLAETQPAITGAIRIAPAVKNKVSPTAALYIIARHEGETSGPPAAVKRIPAPLRFPIRFSLSQDDAMIPNTPFEGKFTIAARVSQSGSATPVSPGDIESEPSKPIAPGSKPIVIELDKIKK